MNAVRIGLGIDDQGVGIRAVGDPHLAAIEDVVIALAVGAQSHRHHVGTGTRLTHGQGADVFAGDELGQVLLLLLGTAVAADLIDAQVRMGAVRKADRSRRTAYFLHRHDMGEIAHMRPAILLFNGDPEQAEIAHLRPQVERKLVAAVDFGRARRNFGRSELLHGRAQHGDRLAEMKIERRKVGHDQCSATPVRTPDRPGAPRRVAGAAAAVGRDIVNTRGGRRRGSDIVNDVYVNVNSARARLPAAVRAMAQALAALSFERVDFFEHDCDVFLLLLEHGAALGEHLQELDELRAFAARRGIQIEQFANFRKRQPEPLATQDKLDAHPFTFTVDAATPAAARRKQTLVLVEAYRAGRQRELPGEVGNGERYGIGAGGHCGTGATRGGE